MPDPSQADDRAKYRLNFFGEITLANMLDWLVAFALGALLVVMTDQLGGARAETQLLGVWLTALLLVIYAFWVMVAEGGKGVAIDRRVLYFIPFLVFSLLSWLFISPVAWAARSEAVLILQAFIVVWVVAHGLRTRNHVWFLFLLLGGVALVGVIMAFTQYFRASGMLPKLFNPLEFQFYALSGHDRYLGQATGTLAAPGSFAGLLLLTLFPAMIFAFSRHLSGIIRIFIAYLALMYLIGLLMTLSRGALLVLLPGFFFLPYMLRLGLRGKVITWVSLAVLLAASVGFIVAYSERFSTRWRQLFEPTGEGSRLQVWESAWQLFRDHPVIGRGLGSFRYSFDLYRPAGFNADAAFVQNEYLQGLAEWGLLGTLLLALPLLLLFVLGLRTWGQLPDSIALEERGRRGKRLRRMPARKLFLAAACLGLFTFGLHLLVESHLRVPALLFWAAAFFGIIVKYAPPRPFKLPPGAFSRWGFPGLLLALAAVLALGLTQGYRAEIHAFEGARMAEQYAREFSERSSDRQFADDRIEILETAIHANPQHVPARIHYALALADSSYLKPTHRQEIGQLAEAEARQALESFPHYAQGWVVLGESLYLQERWAEAGDAYKTALELAPMNATYWYYYANWLNGEPGRRSEALEAIDRCLELHPENALALRLRRKILIP